MERIVYNKTLDVHKSGVQFTLQGFETADRMSRRIVISLMASGDAYDLPLEQMEAVMYVSTPGIEETSINVCTIKDNTIIYDALPITEEGITTMQLKIIGTRADGVERVIASPKFAVEVIKSDAEDESIKGTASYTAVEEALSRAKAVYDSRLLRVALDSDCMFCAYYADGTVYESNVLKELFLKGDALLSQSFAKGGTGVRDNEETDNAMYYSNVAKSMSSETKAAGENALGILEEVKKQAVHTVFAADFETGELFYESAKYTFEVDNETGVLKVIGGIEDTMRLVVEEWFEEQGVTLPEIKDAVNKNAEDIAGLHKLNIESRLNDLKFDGFHVGDVRNSGSETLGEDYLLCNGDYIFSYNGYDELIKLLQKNGQTWYHEHRISHAGILDDGKLIVCGDKIYALYADKVNGGCIVRVYNGYENLIQGNYNQIQILDSLNATGIHSVAAFMGKLFVIYTYSDKNNYNTYFEMASASLDDLTSWQKIDGFSCVNISPDELKMIVGKDMLLVACVRYSSSTYNSWMSYWFTTDGAVLNEGTFKIISDGTGNGTPSYHIGFQNDSWIFSIRAPVYSNTGMSDLYIVSNNATLTGEWSNIVLESFTGENIVYYDRYYWSVQTPYNQTSNIRRTQNIAGDTWETFSEWGEWGKSNKIFMVRNNMLILGNQKYDKTLNNFITLENSELKDCALTKEGASTRACAGENNDVRIEYVGNNTTDVFCIPKTFAISTVPAISESTSYYTYIKAKE